MRTLHSPFHASPGQRGTTLHANDRGQTDVNGFLWSFARRWLRRDDRGVVCTLVILELISYICDVIIYLFTQIHADYALYLSPPLVSHLLFFFYATELPRLYNMLLARAS